MKNEYPCIVARFIRTRAGQTLVETMVALTIFIVGMLGLLSLLTRSYAMSNVVSENYIATYLAAEGVEIVKNILDHNFIVGTSTPWNAGVAGCAGGCNGDWNSQTLFLSTGGPMRLVKDPVDARNLYTEGGGGAPTKFYRTIYVTLIDADHIRVNSKVRWATERFSSEVDMEDHFFNPR